MKKLFLTCLFICFASVGWTQEIPDNPVYGKFSFSYFKRFVIYDAENELVGYTDIHTVPRLKAPYCYYKGKFFRVDWKNERLLNNSECETFENQLPGESYKDVATYDTCRYDLDRFQFPLRVEVEYHPEILNLITRIETLESQTAIPNERESETKNLEQDRRIDVLWSWAMYLWHLVQQK